jgi:WXXGXW repeat (2 copies)
MLAIGPGIDPAPGSYNRQASPTLEMVRMLTRRDALLRTGALFLALVGGAAAAAAQTAPLPGSAPPPGAAPPPNLPPPRAEIVPARPPGRWIWQPGHWQWNGVRYVWRPGRYVHPHPRRVHWVNGHWALRRGVWVWVPGHWT